MNQVNQILSELGCNLLFGAVDQMKTDVSLEDFAHKAVHTAAHRGEQHQLAAAVLAGSQGTLDGIELPSHFSKALKEFELFAIDVGHSRYLLDNTYPGYSINPVGV